MKESYIQSSQLITSLRRKLPTHFVSRLKSMVGMIKPNLLILDICGICNAQCPFCARKHMPEDRAKGFMDDEVFHTAIREAKENSIKTVRLYATAEPTLHPRFNYFIDTLKENGFIVEVSTNAYTLQKHFEALSKVDVLQYSIEGWDKDSYEKYRYPLKFDVVRKNISDFWAYIENISSRPKINTGLLLTKATDIHQYLECWGEYVDEINVNFMLPTVRFANDAFISEYQEDLKEEYLDFKYDKGFFCSYPSDSVTVAFDGKFALCCADFYAALPLGNVKNGIGSHFNSEYMTNIRHQFTSQRASICAGCSSYLRPSDELVASIKKQLTELSHPMKHKLLFNY